MAVNNMNCSICARSTANRSCKDGQHCLINLSRLQVQRYLGFVCRKCLREDPGDGIESDCLYRRADNIEGREAQSSFTGHGSEEDFPARLLLRSWQQIFHGQYEEGSANGVLACLESNNDVRHLIVLSTLATAVLTYLGSITPAFCWSVEYHKLGFPPDLQFSAFKAAECRRLSWNILRASYIMRLLPEASHIVHITIDRTVSSSTPNSHIDHSPKWRFLTSPRSLFSRSRPPPSTMAWQRLLRWDGYALSSEPELLESS